MVRNLAIVIATIGALVATDRAPAAGAPSQAATSVGSQLDQADRLKANQQYDEARALYDTALARAREGSPDAEISRALLGRADLFLRLRQWAPGIADAREALALCERLDLKAGIAQARLLLGAFEAGAGNRDAAIATLQQAIENYGEIGDRVSAARAGLRLSGLLADIERLEPVLLRAADDARAADNRALEGAILHRLGDGYFNADRYEEAMSALQRAAGIYKGLALDGELGTVHNSIGRVYRAHGRIDEALREQQLALALHRKGDDVFRLMQSLNAVGVTYERLGYYDEARSFNEQALALAPKVVAEVPNAIDFLQANLAGLLLQTGDFARATTILEGVIARGREPFPGIRWGQLSHGYLQSNRPADALKAAEESIARCGTSKELCARAHGARSQALAALGRTGEAQADAQTALGILEQLRGQLLPGDARREFASGLAFVYTNLIAMSIGSGDPKAALEAAEQARARAFLDLLDSRDPEPSAVVATPTRATVRPSVAAATAADLIATTQRLRSTLVSYWVGDNETFVWVSDRAGRITSKRINVSRSTLLKLIRETKPFDVDDRRRKPFPLVTRGEAPMSLTSDDACWRELYRLLIAPIQPLLPATPGALLTIIPHDVLNGVSFAALKSPSGRYLLEDYTLHYAPAGALFQFTAPRRRPNARTGSVLLVSDPALPRRSAIDEPLPRLPGTRAEATEIAKYLPRSGATILQDTAATENRIRQLSPDRAVLHFATHAIVREDAPFESELMLARSGSDASADGTLTAREIYEMRLTADLVVLSACRSAAGAVPGDAIATFTRAFLYAGTASVIASLWDVADQPTNQLVSLFYKDWLEGADKAAALRRAQLRVLDELRRGNIRVATRLGPVPLPEHPIFWAGFVLFGEPR